MYVAVKGGEAAIDNAHRLLADRRRGDRSVPALQLQQIVEQLGLAVDLVAVPGSGATAARVELRRRAEHEAAFWARKRLVVWCFAAREFTEGDGWALVPVGSGAATGR